MPHHHVRGPSVLPVLVQQAQRRGALHLDTRVVALQLRHRLAAGLVGGEIHRRLLNVERPRLPVGPEVGVQGTVRAVAAPAVHVRIPNEHRPEQRLALPLRGPMHAR